MKIKFVKYLNSEKETLLAIHVFDEEGKEIDSYQFYNNEKETQSEPLLLKSINDLPSLIKLVNKMPEDVVFEEDEILV